MYSFHSEAGDRAIDRRLGHVVGPDAEPRRDAGAEAFENHVRSTDERPGEPCVGLEVARDGLLAGVQRVVPGRSDATQRVAVRRLEPDDSRPESQELPTCECPRQVAGQIDDEVPVQWPHEWRNL